VGTYTIQVAHWTDLGSMHRSIYRQSSGSSLLTTQQSAVTTFLNLDAQDPRDLSHDLMALPELPTGK
jgi:hypothetical protein